MTILRGVECVVGFNKAILTTLGALLSDGVGVGTAAATTAAAAAAAKRCCCACCCT